MFVGFFKCKNRVITHLSFLSKTTLKSVVLCSLSVNVLMFCSCFKSANSQSMFLLNLLIDYLTSVGRYYTNMTLNEHVLPQPEQPKT